MFCLFWLQGLSQDHHPKKTPLHWTVFKPWRVLSSIIIKQLGGRWHCHTCFTDGKADSEISRNLLKVTLLCIQQDLIVLYAIRCNFLAEEKYPPYLNSSIFHKMDHNFHRDIALLIPKQPTYIMVCVYPLLIWSVLYSKLSPNLWMTIWINEPRSECHSLKTWHSINHLSGRFMVIVWGPRWRENDTGALFPVADKQIRARQ